ncbi:MAG: hypothetical protein FJ087_20455, partial [Deltaproteobacteria bacterium]|nr:hypothetical protein [Deltaproteobacteria bacterium]
APADFPADYVAPEVIAIAPPWDPGPLDVQELVDPWQPPEVIAIAPPQDVVAPDQPPEIIAIAPPPPDAVQPEAIAIAPFDAAGPDQGTPPAPQKGGFMDTCLADEDCLQEYFCEQTMFCIAPPPGDGSAKPAGCNEKNCVPVPCSEGDGKCGNGTDCLPYVPTADKPVWTCVRGVGTAAGEFLEPCKADAECGTDQYWCRNVAKCPPGMFCIAPVEPVGACVPLDCGDACPDGSTCEFVGVQDACVKKGS